jgi:hypothetical protein
MSTPHFLVPIDFSACAEQALDYAIRLARTLTARLTVLHVIQPVPMAGVDMGVALPETYLGELEEAVQRNMEEALARVTAAGLTAERVVVSCTCSWAVSPRRWYVSPPARCWSCAQSLELPIGEGITSSPHLDPWLAIHRAMGCQAC